MKKLKLTMILSGLVLLLFGSTYGQIEKFDVMTFASPKGWSVEKAEDSYRFTKNDKKNKEFCAMVLSQSYKTHGSAKGDFQFMWDTTLKKQWGVDIPKEMDIDKSGELTIVQSGAGINYQGIDSFAVLVTISGKNRFVSLLAIMNNTDYLDEVLAFLSTVDFNFPKS